MSSHKPTVCLAMIVKNEVDVIERCLRSVFPYVDAWVISDTGSTDGTQSRIRWYAPEHPGQLYEHPWQDFATNRNITLELAWERAEYALVIDADDVLEPGKNKFPPRRPPTADVSFLEVMHDDVRYWRAHYMKRGSGAYQGVLHEVFAFNEGATTEYLSFPKYHYLSGGARSKDPGKLASDIAVLSKALHDDPTGPLATRYQFYLAQTVAASGDYNRAIYEYTKRVAMGGPRIEEIWYSLFMIAECMAEADVQGQNQSSVIDAYLWAYDFRPERVEPLRQLARYLACTGRVRAAKAINEQANQVPRPARGLQLNVGMYGEQEL